MTRQEFEAFLSAPPHECTVARWPDDPLSRPKFAWPGQYKEYAVQLAWEVLVEAKRRKQAREEKL